MPKEFDFILVEFLKVRKYQPGGFIQDSIAGVPQGGIISPLLSNWALDGLEEILKQLLKERHNGDFRRGFFYDIDKELFLRKKRLFDVTKYIGNCRRQFFSRYSLWFVRYADNFIVGVRGENIIPRVLTALKDFFKERGLAFFKQKIRVQDLRVGTKFEFLG